MANKKKTSSQATLPKVARRKQQLLVVQFPNPGTEAVPTRLEKKSNPIVKAWNQGDHKRKFMKAKGQIVDCNGHLSEKKELLFWGEWEPTSWVEPVTKWNGNGVQPKWLHLPFLYVPSRAQTNQATGDASDESEENSDCGCSDYNCGCQPSGKNCQNTDPLVFGDYFIYSNCRQVKHRNGKPFFTQLAYLEPGSIILFGSVLSDSFAHFALDTVFVVGESRLYRPCDYRIDLKNFIPKDFATIMGNDFMGSKQQYRCYHGISPTDSTEHGMFSFSPCKPYNGVNEGFPRVMLTDKDFATFGNIISNNHIRSHYATRISNLQVSRQIWDRVCQIVYYQGFERGVNFEYKRIP